MKEDFHAETKLDAHRTLIISSQTGRTYIGDGEVSHFPSGGRFFIRERDDRLPEEHGSYLLANVGTLEAAERMIKQLRAAAAGIAKSAAQTA